MRQTCTIITVTYNSAATVARTIRSVLTQSVAPEEYLIIDGASQDETVSIAESYREKLEARGTRLRIVSEPDSGIYNAMNKGIRLATGEIIGLINADDWYEPCAVEAAKRAFRYGHCDVCFGDIRLHRADGTSFVKHARLRRFQTSRDWNHPTMFVDAAVYKSHPFREKGIHDDYGCYLQLRREGARIITIHKVMANFRMGGASNHRSLSECIHRIRDRYLWCYLANGYSPLYLVECVAIEGVKLLLG